MDTIQRDCVRRIAKEYQDINGHALPTLNSPPSPLEFSRLVHISRPALIKGCTHVRHDIWTREYLLCTLGSNHEISVAVTPQGQGADALVSGPDGETYFAEPHVETMSIKLFLYRLADERSTDEAFYLQSQNGNVYPTEPSEFELLRKDLPADISWASEALGRSPEAVNIWIGNSKSVTSIHSDPYENIYTVVRGTKHFTLFPPTEAFCLREQTYKHARYTRRSPSSPLTLTPSSSGEVRWSSITDPTLPESISDALPFQVDVHAGETLYLPPGWWHHVRQTADETGLCIAFNWWYDMEMQGMHWVWLQYLRGTLPEGEKDGAEPIDG
ncbi:Clavaminate synthase-like protein [Gautieria morchelliformis]|nr:Clavaminate synthase-like protein [Gautieria morchelliformis]